MILIYILAGLVIGAVLGYVYRQQIAGKKSAQLKPGLKN